MHHSFGFLLGCVVACLAAGCGGNSVTTTEAPTPVKCTTNLSGLPASVPSTGTKVQATVSAARECSWSATTDATWLALSPDAGQGGAQVTVAVAANNAPTARSGAIVLNGARVTLNQEPASCRFDLNRSSAPIGAEGGRVQVSVTAMAGCAWKVSSPAPWVSSSVATGTGNRTVELTVGPNPGAARSATVEIAGHRFRVDQSSAAAPGAPPPPAPGPTPDPSPTPGPTPGPPWARAIARPAAESGALLHLRGQRRSAAVEPRCGQRQVRSGHAGWLQLDRIDHRQLDPDHSSRAEPVRVTSGSRSSATTVLLALARLPLAA